MLPEQPVLDPLAYRDALIRLFTEAGGTVRERPARKSGGWLVSTTPDPAFDHRLLRPRLRMADWSWVELAGDRPQLLPRRSATDLDVGGRIWAPNGDRLWFGSRRDDGRGQVARWFPEAEVVRQWSSRAAAAFDAMPFVGYAGSRRLVATGFDAWELVLGSAAAQQLVAVLSGSGAADLPWSPVRLVRPMGALRAGVDRPPPTADQLGLTLSAARLRRVRPSRRGQWRPGDLR